MAVGFSSFEKRITSASLLLTEYTRIFYFSLLEDTVCLSNSSAESSRLRLPLFPLYHNFTKHYLSPALRGGSTSKLLPSYFALLELPLITLGKNALNVDSRFSFKAYMPTVATNMKDYLVTTYELCEDG
ncbi:hypothetical protein Nepgr_011850 [Nepenthes gracilis]|uniref:Uncharacterized protein n=1 Tax=Nepenthes gracilis TaxID=150966 RepID=A0AAD3SG14_NEPGR|nr:hypothetical protein Nepgr_011850 [Nepenthes gracilis]